MTLENVVAFAAVSFMIAISPGASWVYVIQSTIHVGQKGGFVAVLGNAIGILLHAAFAFLGLAIFVQLIPQLFFILKMCGSLYLFYMGVKNIFYAKELSFKKVQKNVLLKEVLIDGIFMNLLNPKVVILMIALLPQFVDIKSNRLAALYLGSLHAIVASIVLSFVTILARRFLVRNHHAVIFSWCSGLVLCVFAIQLLFFDFS
ncbi:LysE family translocator [Candidatus Uabimicrobium sp. HlEnr_7]|uniref:LysE family translocator n=1 Tax=Candidatus Uabimicrobium helgolandensis TaxID=3095367 RepID=UPI00355655F6